MEAALAVRYRAVGNDLLGRLGWVCATVRNVRTSARSDAPAGSLPCLPTRRSTARHHRLHTLHRSARTVSTRWVSAARAVGTCAERRRHGRVEAALAVRYRNVGNNLLGRLGWACATVRNVRTAARSDAPAGRYPVSRHGVLRPAITTSTRFGSRAVRDTTPAERPRASHVRFSALRSLTPGSARLVAGVLSRLAAPPYGIRKRVRADVVSALVASNSGFAWARNAAWALSAWTVASRRSVASRSCCSSTETSR